MIYFFSYARADDSHFLRKFYDDLRSAVRSKVGAHDPDSVAFRDAVCIEPGKPWTETITDALRTCNVFVYLHTPAYYSRDGCGKEFAVVRSRLALAGSRPDDLRRQSCIQPIFWDGDIQVPNLPPDIAAIQITHQDYGDEYNRRGLLQIVRAWYSSDVYWQVVDTMAQRIKTAAEKTPLPPLRTSPEWKGIVPLFPVYDVKAPPVIAPKFSSIRPPRYARFVWIVGKREELEEIRNAESLESYDPDGIPEEWRPFLPDTTDPARLIATDAVRQVDLSYQSEQLPKDDHELRRLIEEASDAYTPVVVVTDVWSVRLAKYQAMIKIFDKGKLDNCVVLFPWNLKEYDTNKNLGDLRDTLAKVFPIQFYKSERSLHFDITDVATFKAELSKLLTKYIADINRSLKAARDLPTADAFKAPPQLASTTASA